MMNPPDDDDSRKSMKKRAIPSKPYHDKLLNRSATRKEVGASLRLHRNQARQNNQSRLEQEEAAAAATRLQAKRVCAAAAANCNYNSKKYHSTSRPGSSFGNPLIVQEDLNSALPGKAIGPDLDLGNSGTSFPQYTAPGSLSVHNSFPCPPTSRSPTEKSTSGMESDVLNFGVSAERAGFFEIGPSGDFEERSSFEQVVEFPAWMNANVDESCGGDSFEDPALPCINIQGMEGTDGEWFAQEKN